MIPAIEDMRYVDEFRVWLRFQDGTEGEVDLSGELWGDVFEPLKDINYFRTVRLDRELDTICWDNGADFAPESLYRMVASVPA